MSDRSDPHVRQIRSTRKTDQIHTWNISEQIYISDPNERHIRSTQKTDQIYRSDRSDLQIRPTPRTDQVPIRSTHWTNQLRSTHRINQIQTSDRSDQISSDQINNLDKSDPQPSHRSDPGVHPRYSIRGRIPHICT